MWKELYSAQLQIVIDTTLNSHAIHTTCTTLKTFGCNQTRVYAKCQCGHEWTICLKVQTKLNELMQNLCCCTVIPSCFL